MTFTNWLAMESAMRSSEPQQRITRATLRRVFSFARPHLGELVVFLVLSRDRRRAHRRHPGARRAQSSTRSRPTAVPAAW